MATPAARRWNGAHGGRLGFGTGDVQRPAQLQRGAVPGGGQDRGAHSQAALLPRRRMGMDRGGRVVRRPRAQPRAAHVFRRHAPDRRAQFPSRLFRIGRLAIPILAHHACDVILFYVTRLTRELVVNARPTRHKVDCFW